MSQENVERVARIFSDQLPALYGLMSGTTEDFVWDMTTFEGFPEARAFHGFAGFIEFLEKWVEPYDEWGIDLEDIVDAGGDRVVATLLQTGVIRGSESRVEMRYGIVYSLHDGKLQRAAAYATPQKALEAAGLSE